MKSVFARSLIATSMLFAATAAQAAAPAWSVIPDKSMIEWTASYAGKPVTGSFKDLNATIMFDPEHLEESSVLVRINVSKIISDDKDAEQALPAEDWFNTAKFAEATFESKTMRHLEGEKYEAEGTLTLAGVAKTIKLPFTVHFYDDKESTPPAKFAQVTAETTLHRLEFGLGKGEWSKTDSVADDVKVSVNLKAHSASETAAH